MKIKLIVPLLLLLGLMWSLTATNSPQLPKLSSNAKILAFGDSLTAGYGVSKQHSYPNVLSQLTGLDVINAGVSGEVTEQGLSRLPQILSQHQVELMILLQGGNDILRSHNLAQTKHHLAEMIDIAKQRQVEVILIGVPEKKLFSNSAPLYQELAEQYDLVFDGDIIRQLLTDQSMKSDSVHFNQLGYRRLAMRIQRLLQEHGAI
ncbi:GDSL-type esterase/lipase family protein [Thalassotalea ponticola]|uniref:GDSL-type esterase/lipase family protein n=1 Tax=Thalassotalea ponticola TaxID=1523392 RepID=UPI0025B51BD9|nr:GDSL-type esterase/lipase family protein [Thalassotalea ponticola]MDN3653023.1 GDSL-type esterase/lipase family protein [Thalassotalea ponticola]